jgi:hypothetical protein
MLPWGGSLAALIASVYGRYDVAFWAMIINILAAAISAGAVLRDPSWYIARQRYSLPKLQDEVDVATVVASKLILIVVSSILAWYFGKWDGYF